MTSTGVSPPNNAHSPSGEILNRVEALSRVEDDRGLMADLIEIFLDESGPMMKAIRSAVQSGDAGQIEKSSHRLKGSLSVFGADEVAQSALELERIGRSGDLSSAVVKLAQLEQLMASLQPALQEFARELQS